MSEERIASWDAQLQAVHDRPRDALRVAREAVDASEADLPRDLALYCVGFCVALDGHHASEDAALFPLITAAHPDLADVVGKLKQDHAMLGTLLGRFRAAVDSGATGETLHRHLDGIGAIMESHFGFEERRLLAPLRTLAAGDRTGSTLFGPLG